MSAGAGPPSGSGRAPLPAPRPGDQCGPLDLLAEIGAGATGRVFRARHRELGRTSAVKIVAGALADEQRRRRFQRELEALGRLSHPGIVRLHAAFPVPWGLACELELIEGESLDARLAREGPLPWRQAAGLVAELARAVGHAHTAGVLHRDLKPANVLLRADGQPVLADLGLSRLSDERSSLTAAGAVIGTPLFMPLEGLKGQMDTPAVDVYGLGAVLHAALTGEPPVNAGSLPALARALDSGPTPLPGGLVPAGLEAVRMRALAREPRARHPTPEALAADLEAVLAGRAPSSTATGARLLLAARARWPRAALVAGLAALVVGLPLVVQGLARSSGGGLPADDPLARAIAQVRAGEDPQGLGLRRLLRAGEEPGDRARLLAALAAEPGELAPALRVARASALLVGGQDPAASDLAGLAGLPASADGEALLERVRGRLPGPEGLLEAARAIRAAHGDWPAAALLHAEACLRRGDPALRDEARAALEAARGPRATRIKAALLAADALVEGLARGEDTLGPRLGASADALGALQAPELLGGVLAPVGPALWEALVRGGLLVAGSVREVARLLRSYEEQLGPQLVVLIDMARTDPLEGKAESDPARLARAAVALREADPVLSAWADTRVVEHALEPFKRGGQSDPVRLRALAAQAEAALLRLESVPPESLPRNATAFQLLCRRRCATAAAQTLLELARGTTGADRREIYRRAERPAVVAAEVSRDVMINNWLDRDAMTLVQVMAELGRLEECEVMLPWFPRPGAVRAELARRAGRGEEALRLLDEAAAREEPPPWAGNLAVRAKALADLGRMDEAREALKALRGAGRQVYPELPAGFRVADVSGYLEGR